MASSDRDPRRSLIIGSVIAAVVLALVVLFVLIGVYLVFEPRSSDRETWRGPRTVAAAAAAPIHLVPTADS